jgi:hypothetical protein
MRAVLRALDVTHPFELGEDVALQVPGRGELWVELDADVVVTLPEGFDVEATDDGLAFPRLLGASAGPVEIVLDVDGTSSTLRLEVVPLKLPWPRLLAAREALSEASSVYGEHRGVVDAAAARRRLGGVLERWTAAVQQCRRRPLPELDAGLRGIAALAVDRAETLGDPSQIAQARAVVRQLGRGGQGPLRLQGEARRHPGYNAAHRVRGELVALSSEPGLVFAAGPDLDLLWERWCALTMVRTVAEVLGRDPLSAALTQDDDVLAWARDRPVLDGRVGALSVRLWVEPEYAHDGDTRFVKLVPGRPWRPDLVLEVARGGVPYALHVFDAKHSHDLRRRDRRPLDTLASVWDAYGETLVERDSQRRAVWSVWVLWPAPRPSMWARDPAMLSPGWPSDRLRGGTVGLVPGEPGGQLRQVLRWILQGEGSA